MNPLKTSYQPLTLARRWMSLRVFFLVVFILFLFTFRYTILTLFYICQTYVVWNQFTSSVISIKDNFDSSMTSYPLNQTSADPSYENKVPPILHHIVIGSIDLSKRPTWLAARDACLKWHPNYEYRFWNDSSAEQLIREVYPWFYSTWKNYPYPIQRADSLRYLVLYQYGGIFLDMDLHCRRSLGPLRRFEFVSPSAYPVGISNGFLMASTRHPFIKSLVDQLPLFDRDFLLPYATVMFSTGCMYISAQYALYQDRTHLRILNYTEHRLSGRILTPLFQHEGSSSWHSNDASFIKLANNFLKFAFSSPNFEAILTFLFLLIFLSLFTHYRRRTRLREKIEEC